MGLQIEEGLVLPDEDVARLVRRSLEARKGDLVRLPKMSREELREHLFRTPDEEPEVVEVEPFEVTITSLGEDLLDGLPHDEVAFLRALVGKVVQARFSADHRVEVEATDEVGGIVHYLTLNWTDVSTV